MAFSEIELKGIEKAVGVFMKKRRPPVEIRAKLDFGFRIDNQSVELFEIRPRWNDPTDLMENPIAKATFVKSQKSWKVYWLRSNLRWEAYEPCPMVKNIQAFLALVDEDECACFFG